VQASAHGQISNIDANIKNVNAGAEPRRRWSAIERQ